MCSRGPGPGAGLHCPEARDIQQTKALVTKAGYIQRLSWDNGSPRAGARLGGGALGPEGVRPWHYQPSSGSTGLCGLRQGSLPAWASVPSLTSKDASQLPGGVDNLAADQGWGEQRHPPRTGQTSALPREPTVPHQAANAGTGRNPEARGRPHRPVGLSLQTETERGTHESAAVAEHPGVCHSGALALGTHRLRAEQATALRHTCSPQTCVTCHHGMETAQIRGTRDRWAGAGKAKAALNWQNSRAGRAPHVRVVLTPRGGEFAPRTLATREKHSRS